MALQHEDIKTLIGLFESSDWHELNIDVAGDRFSISKGGRQLATPDTPAAAIATSLPAARAAQGQPLALAAQPSVQQPAPAALGANQTYICASGMGVIWLQPKPGTPAYVEMGQVIQEGATVCLIEIMKLFTIVQAEKGGRLIACLVQNGQMVEVGTPLFIAEHA